jgi:hypothetical protein
MMELLTVTVLLYFRCSTLDIIEKDAESLQVNGQFLCLTHFILF